MSYPIIKSRKMNRYFAIERPRILGAFSCSSMSGISSGNTERYDRHSCETGGTHSAPAFAIDLDLRWRNAVTLQEARGTANRIRLLLVEDYEPWRRSVRSMLQNVTEAHVICEVSDGLAAVQQSQVLQPDLILLDIGLPLLNGIDATRRIREVSPASKILFVSENRCWDVAELALRSGGSGYVVKSKAASELLPAVEAVLQGKLFLSVGLTDLDPIHIKEESTAGPAQREEVDKCSRPQSFKITSHEVRLYPDDAGLADGFARSIKDALNNKHLVVVVATESQRAAILQK
jgi:DNA-binding NarL/FixJ family response regulator